ncbi:matrixin family metalloprotease [Nocardioides houyundeii]|uniref:matrixin family metalloprotease n=1 Tax=Nocardioides houyundeii TaxID=2045452 RepID=UPI000DF243BA|nr:matrixin family metalloprotease [Nocardioides houyundeii]
MSSRSPARTGRTAPSLVTALALVLAATGATLGSAPDQPARPSGSRGEVELVSDGMRVPSPRAGPGIELRAPAQVGTGGTIVISGRIRSAPRSRTVRLALRGPGGWQELARKRSTRAGLFRLRAFAGDVGTTLLLRVQVSAPRLRVATRRLRVSVVAASGTGETPVVETPTVDPQTGYDPTDPTQPAPGSSSDWSYLLGASSARWDPCTPIGWGYDETGAYPGALLDVTTALAGVASRTGLTFAYQGTVGEQLDISWSTEAQDVRLAGNVAGYGGASAVPLPPGSADVDHQLVRGRMVLDSEARLRPGFRLTGTPTWGQVMLHELLHVVGLGHATGPDQLMYGVATSENHRLGAGDLAGLLAVGSRRGCLPDPPS